MPFSNLFPSCGTLKKINMSSSKQLISSMRVQITFDLLELMGFCTVAVKYWFTVSLTKMMTENHLVQLINKFQYSVFTS